MVSWTVVGFDSAWTDNAKAPGAVCAIRCDHHGHLSSSDPQLASFDQAFDFISGRAIKVRCLCCCARSADDSAQSWGYASG